MQYVLNFFYFSRQHNINLAHSGFDSLTGKTGNDLEYGDMSGAMGYCCDVRCYNAPHAYELGWLQPSLELNDSNFGPGSRLSNIVLNSMPVSDTSAITLTGSWSGGKKFWCVSHRCSVSLRLIFVFLNQSCLAFFTGCSTRRLTHSTST